MGEVLAWTGHEANVLRTSMRLSLRTFAEHLGISLGTVALWNRRGTTIRPTPEMQAVLDTTLSRCPPEVQARFEVALRESQQSVDAPVEHPARTAPTDTDHLAGGQDPSASSAVSLTVLVDGRPVTLSLEAVAAAARATRHTDATRPTTIPPDAAQPPRPTVFTGDERAYELFVRGHALLATNDRQEIEAAQELLQQAVDRDPRFARAIAARGYTSWRRYFAGWCAGSHALTDALRDVQAALEVDPGSVAAHVTFVRACWDMGWHERALEAGRSIHERYPDSLDATVAFARSLTNAGLAQYALPLVASVLAVDPTHPAAVKLSVWCHVMVGDHAGAVEAARSYLIRHPGDANTRWAVALAWAYLPEGHEHAAHVAQDGLDADQDDVTLWVLLGYLHRHRGDEDAARRAWERGADAIVSLDADRSNSRTRAWTANLLAAAGRGEAATTLLDELTMAEPRNGYLRYRLAHVLAELGRPDEAVAMLAGAVAEGFLSVQLLQQEIILALAPMRGREGFASVVQELHDRVEHCGRLYAAGLPASAVLSRDGELT